MEENWRYVDRNLSDYIKCRRKLQDFGGDADKIASMDDQYRAEFGNYADYALTQIKSYRQNGRFDYARGFEKGLEEHIEDYKEISESTDKPDAVAAKMEKIQKAHRDPEVVRAEKAEAAFKAWKKNATKVFNDEWKQIQAAEEKAMPEYEAGMKALEAGEYDKAVKKLTAASQKLYSEAYPSVVAMDAAINNGSIKRGLSYKIAAGVARAHFEAGNKAKMYSELPIIKHGRDWLSKEKELKIRL